MSRENELRRLSVQIRILEGTAGELQSRINFVNAALTDLRLSMRSMEGIGMEKRDAELMVPIGGGSYIKARLDDPNIVIAGIGANISIERSLPEALESIKKRIEEFEKLSISLRQQLDQVIRRIEEGRSRLRTLAEEMVSKER